MTPVNTGDKFIASDKGTNQKYLRPSTSHTASDGVIGSAMKSWIPEHPTHLDQKPLRPPKLNNGVLV
jgi:hypothetical protein